MKFLIEDDEVNGIKILNEIDNHNKQNASYPDFKTPTKLDQEVQDILESIKPDVMEAIKKTNYFDKNQ